MKRRKFIKHTACAGMGSATLLSSLLNMKALGAAAMANSSVIDSNDYKALVCVFLSGGNDSYNMLLPREGTPYQEYARSRSNNAIRREDIIAIHPTNGDGKALGLHPNMPHLAQMFNDGKASFLVNIGTLVEPTSIDQFYTNSVSLPLGLYSHSDQSRQWQTALPQDRSTIGWMGAMGELIGDMNSNQNLSLSVSLSGSNFIQTGVNTIPYVMSPEEGPSGLHQYGEDWDYMRWRDRAVHDMLEAQYDDIFEQTFVNTFKSSLDSYTQFSEALSQIPPSSIVFPNDDWNFGQSLKVVSDTIAARNFLDLQRQTYFVQFGDWDHHDELVNNHATQLRVLDQSLKAFYDDLERQGVSDQVTTFVISEFGRPLVSNGNGTDHAWGGNVFVLGGSIDGQKVFGRYPDLNLNDRVDLGGGIFVPEISADEYFAELAMWFGVPALDLPLILPNIGNFYDVGSGQMPIGFLR